jgi:predicted alpha/beta hydrolase family esterase
MHEDMQENMHWQKKMQENMQEYMQEYMQENMQENTTNMTSTYFAYFRKICSPHLADGTVLVGASLSQVSLAALAERLGCPLWGGWANREYSLSGSGSCPGQ